MVQCEDKLKSYWSFQAETNMSNNNLDNLRRASSAKQSPEKNNEEVKDNRRVRSAFLPRENKNQADQMHLKINEEQNGQDEIDMLKDAKVMEKMRSLVQAFVHRGEKVKQQIASEIPEEHYELDSSINDELQSIVEEEWMKTMDITRMTQLKKSVYSECCYKIRHRELGAFEPQSSIYIFWLFIVSLAFVYNAVVIFLRSVFPFENDDNRLLFFIFDYICDGIYIMDMIWFKMRLKFVLNGEWIEDIKMTRRNYLGKRRFIIDLLALLPLDLLYIKYGYKNNLLRLLRLPRLLKAQTFWEFFSRIDAITKYPYFIRIIHTLIYKIYLIHLSTCAYYLVSWHEGFGSTPWTYNNEGNAYLRCFYFAFRTATSIGGRMPKPTNDLERFYMIVSWLMGVFVFALLIGQIRDIVATATQNKTNFRQIINQTVRYMRNLNIPHDLQKRVRLWLNFTWDQQKTFDENKILKNLPLKVRTDLALSIHYQTLSKVNLFKDCDRTLLRDLVLKLRSVLFLPGDYVCRKGEVGTEMYIVNKGFVHVMGGENGNTVLATLAEGSVFGEYAIMGIQDCARRTADVKSLGYSNLFILSKNDLWDTLKNYPEYQVLLKRKVKKLMKIREKGDSRLDDDEDSKSDDIEVESIIKEKRSSTPKLVHTVLQVLPNQSRIGQYLNQSRSSSIARSSFSHSQSPNFSPILSINSQCFTSQTSVNVAGVSSDDNSNKNNAKL